MKNILIGLLLIFTGAQANARSLQRSQSASLLTFNFAAGTSLAQADIQSGNIEIDFLDNTVTLRLQPAMPNCEHICIQMMPGPIEISLPIVSIESDRCGNIFYTALQDQRPVDGNKETIQVIDHRLNRCPTFAILPPTSVVYISEGFSRMSGISFKNVHTFTATRLQ